MSFRTRAPLGAVVVAFLFLLPPVMAPSGRTTVPPVDPHGTPIGSTVAFATPAPAGPPPSWDAALSHLHFGDAEARHALLARASDTSQNNSSTFNAPCFGIWPPVGGNSLYTDDCYGHDEPGFAAYSSLPGSGGNVTWNMTLPTDRSPTQLQTYLYGVVWFGLMLSTPVSATRECFLELQFFPDASATTLNAVPGNWIGLARVTQINPTTGLLDTCYWSPLWNSGVYNQPLNMHEGDRLTIRMTGWIGSTTGETIRVDDLTQGTYSPLTLYNQTGHYPIDPAYPTNQYPNALQWTDSGAYPISFSMETGHAHSPPYPENSTYNGCTPGGPAPTPQDPAVPCPNYDPGSWANDTGTPLVVEPPVYFNAQAQDRPGQVVFLDGEGGIGRTDHFSNGSCTGREGSAWCSYPWFSYSCAKGGFEFGATDYPETTTDFGKFLQFSSVRLHNALRGPFEQPTPASLPVCGAPSANLTVVSGTPSEGVASFLGQNVTAAQTFAPLLRADYALDAGPASGAWFSDWVTTGGASVADPGSPSTTVTLTGDGTVTAEFTTNRPTVPVTFDVVGSGRIQVSPGRLYADPSTVQTIAAGTTLDLAPGPYMILGLPDPGYAFVDWSSTSGGVVLGAPRLSMSPLDVLTSAPSDSVTLDLSPTGATTTVSVEILGGAGTVELAGVNYSTTTTVTLLSGSYPMVLHPAPGGWVDYLFEEGVVVSVDGSNSTNLSFDPGNAWLTVLFFEGVQVTFDASPAHGGIEFNFEGVQLPGTTLIVGQAFPTEYPVIAVADPGYQWVGWNVAPASALWYDAAHRTLLVNASGTVTALFGPATASTLQVVIEPAGAGSITLGENAPYTSALTNLSVSPDSYAVSAAPSAGYVLAGWVPSGSAVVTPSVSPWPSTESFVTTGVGAGVLKALFFTAYYPVTVVSTPPGATVNIAGVPVVNGFTIPVAAGTYALGGTLGTGAVVGGWTATPNLKIVGPPGAWSIVVTGPGTVYAAGSGALDAFVEATLTSGPAPLAVAFQVIAFNGTPTYSYAWTFGDGTRATGSSPTHTFATLGPQTVSAWVNDSGGASALRTVVIDVTRPAVIVSILTNVTGVARAPFWVRLESSVAGGVSPFTYDWVFGDGGADGTIDSPIHEYSSAGTYPVNLTVTDAVGTSGWATYVFSVLPDQPSVTVTATPDPVTLGSEVELSAVVTLANGPLSYEWTDLPMGCVSANVPEVHCTPTDTGNFSFGVTILDGTGANVTASSTVVVEAAPPGTSGSTILGLPAVLVFGIIAALGVLAVVVALRAVLRRKRPPAAVPP